MNIKAIQLEPPKSGAWENANLRKVQRFLLLKTALRANIEEFLKKINLLSESIFEFNERNDELVLERQEFPENKYEKHVVENPEFGLLNNSAQGLFENLIIYYETAFYKYDVYELYSQNQDSFKQEIQQQITDFCQKNYRTIAFPMIGSIERLQKDCLRDMKTALMIKDELNKAPTVEAYIEAYKSFQKEFVEKFNEMITKRFEKGISQVFVSPFRQKLRESIKEIVISDNLIQKHFRNRSQFRKDIYKELENMFSRYFIEGEITELFDIKVFHNTQNIVTLFCIIILTDYQETDDAKKQAYFNILQRLYDMFMGMYGEAFTELPQYLELIKMQNKTPEIVQKLNQALEENKQKWSQKMNQSENLAAMMSLFLAFNFVSEEGLDKSYTCHTRYMLKCAFRNLKNGAMQFTNFQVLCCMESLIMEYAKNLNNSQVKMDGSGSLVVNDVLERIRSTSVSSIAEHLEHEGQLSALTDKFDKAIVKPEKFFFEKISDPKVRSKAIIICVSGFISEDHTKTGEWKYVCEAYPDTEVIAVNWKSNAIASIGENMWSNVKEKFNTGGNILSKIWKGGMAVYRSGRDAWSKTYEQAVLTGRYLAHFLANTELFQGHVVNLMGFSLGTLVIMSCVWELEKMNRYDIVYDVLLMGGVAHIGNFHTSMLKAVGHRVTNCYCSSDYILSYVLSHVNQNINPIGLGPILWEDNKVVNVDVTHVANGHIRYRGVLGEILARTNFNEDLDYLINQ